MEKKPFVTKEQLDKIVEKYPTPFHLYDEKGTDRQLVIYTRHFHGMKDLKNISQ